MIMTIGLLYMGIGIGYMMHLTQTLVEPEDHDLLEPTSICMGIFLWPLLAFCIHDET